VERREHDRFPLWFPVQVTSETVTEGMAVSHDTSLTGMLINVATQLAVGTEVTLAFRVPPDHPSEHRVKGKILRVTPNTDDPYGLWPQRMAVEFDEPQPGIEASVREQAEKWNRRQ
jgi:hypothetical protein